MKPIIEYQDYRSYIFDYYDERRKESDFSWRRFAALAGFASVSYLKLVCDRKTRLSAKSAPQVAAAMKLVGYKYRYFILMVEYDNAKDPSKKEKIFQEMMSLGEKHRVHIQKKNDFNYFDSWRNPVIRELAAAMPNASDEQIAEKCLPETTADEIARTLDFLLNEGLLVKDENGLYHQTGKFLSTGPLGNVPMAVKNMHRQMGQIALNALDEMPESDRLFSGVTFGLAGNALKKIEEELARCRRRIVAIATESDETEQVFRLNLQLFPLSKKIHEKK
ncbi:MULTISPECIES: TIGR02147 family protein [unclassified Fibrobacter]|uniref:TIGR02147 family protein n=1 Tax=unclassified Fibrobacter TaxID=2634177 RepID=UPI000D6D029F|nr:MULTISPECIES: TIGR02147 family protein [unclassified Fibrobacter]PWJ61470.1 uncharacterized protein (TIGR02147 family) [Fibrobacter sp. UWR4]PZW67286.1 uncharacterized protein (TIGR02147 family) [Fibrobacter sp. UWR1]